MLWTVCFVILMVSDNRSLEIKRSHKITLLSAVLGATNCTTKTFFILEGLFHLPSLQPSDCIYHSNQYLEQDMSTDKLLPL